jgi:hypothetical protein
MSGHQRWHACFSKWHKEDYLSMCMCAGVSVSVCMRCVIFSVRVFLGERVSI